MGKSLIIKDADFSANGIPVTVLLGTLKKVSISTGLNTSFTIADIMAMNPSGTSVKVLIGTDDSNANTSMQGRGVVYIKTVSPYSTYGSALWGTPLEINISDFGNSIICQDSNNPTTPLVFENVEMWLKVYE